MTTLIFLTLHFELLIVYDPPFKLDILVKRFVDSNNKVFFSIASIFGLNV